MQKILFLIMTTTLFYTQGFSVEHKAKSKTQRVKHHQQNKTKKKTQKTPNLQKENKKNKTNKKKKPQKTKKKEDLFDNSYYRTGYKSGFEEGYEKARKEFQQQIRETKEMLLATHKATAFWKEKRITPPMMFRKTDIMGNMKPVIKGCEFKGELSQRELALLPEIIERNPVSTGGAKIPDMSYGTGYGDNILATKLNKRKKYAYFIFNNTKFNEGIFKHSKNKKYPFKINGNTIKVGFPSVEDGETFCKKYDIKPIKK